jgi:hypothetical protein
MGPSNVRPSMVGGPDGPWWVYTGSTVLRREIWLPAPGLHVAIQPFVPTLFIGNKVSIVCKHAACCTSIEAHTRTLNLLAYGLQCALASTLPCAAKTRRCRYL